MDWGFRPICWRLILNQPETRVQISAAPWGYGVMDKPTV